MARNSDRQFSEGGGLNAGDLGRSVPEAEDRLPAWAQQREEAADPEAAKADKAEDAPTGDEAPPETGEDAPAENEEDDAPEGEYDFTSSTQNARKAADEAWTREATRVEGGQYRRNRPAAAAEEDGEAPVKTKKNKKKKNQKKNQKKSRKKKSASEAEEKRGFIKLIAIVLICGTLFVMIAMMIMSNFISHPVLALPRQVVTTLITPLQTAFSGVTDSVVSYLRTLKIRGNLEYAYEQVLIQLEEMANEIAVNEELRIKIQQLEEELNEWKADESHKAMNPLLAQVIGTVGNNYFSTLTLNVGSSDGVGDYMAVVHNGGLVGVTYDTKENSCSVRCIIDSDCTVAGLVQSSRDQGSIKGTLGTNGEPMCRMYYLPDNSLPRPGDVVVTSGVGLEFPKGIPIGYIRESTRGMEDNKSYVVLEPVVDFQHLEYVTVYRYRPLYTESAQTRASTSQSIALEPLATARPIPSFEMEGLSDFMYSATDAPGDAAGETAVPSAEPETVSTPTPTLTPDPNATPLPQNLEYHAIDRSGATATPSPRPTFTPTPSPAPTPDAGAMTVEDDE